MGVAPSAQTFDKSPTERKQEKTSTSLRHHGKCRLDKTRGRLCSPAASVYLPAETAVVLGRLSLTQDVYAAAAWARDFLEAFSIVLLSVFAAHFKKSHCS